VAPPRRVRQALSQAVGVVGATGGREISRRMVSERASQRAFFGVSALLFAASAAMTIVRCASMSAMGEMPMPGGWTMSMARMRMPGQTWLGVAASFLDTRPGGSATALAPRMAASWLPSSRPTDGAMPASIGGRS
jgi:hypothetical protein